MAECHKENQTAKDQMQFQHRITN